MSLDKAIARGKEHRKEYYRSGRYDVTCRPHGSCAWCRNNRLHNVQVKLASTEQQIKEWKYAKDDKQ